MQPFTAQDHAVIAGAITRAEKKTSGEIVIVVARASSRYRYFSLMCVALLALLVPLPLIHFTKWPIEYVYLLQRGVFGLGALLMQWAPLRVAITPASVKRSRANKRAVEQFLVQNLHTTNCLLYTSDA